jgi:hypothetical protein
MLVLIYVNNILIVNLPTYKGRAAAAQFTTALKKKYKLKDIGELNWFLKMRVTRDQSQKKIWLSQDLYIKAITVRYHLNNLARWPTIPLPLQKLHPNKEIASPS